MSIAVGLVYGFISIDRSPDPLEERQVDDKDARQAGKFACYITDFAANNNFKKFSSRFGSIPQEDREYIWQTLSGLKLKADPVKITSPTRETEKAKSKIFYVYIQSEAPQGLYRFEVKKYPRYWAFNKLTAMNRDKQ
jgi:hypothetical protein